MHYDQDEIQDYLICKKSKLIELPFFKKIDKKANSFILENFQKKTDYTIWGGVAANLLLQLLKITSDFYSIHDVEFFLVQENRIFYNQEVYSDLNKTFTNNKLLPIGGLSVIKRLKDSKVNDFQRNRLKMKDGDLYMNSISMEVSNEQIKFSAPLNQIKNLFNNHLEVIIKDFDDLNTPEKLERRIRRTIPKIIRLQEISNFHIGQNAKNKLNNMASMLQQNIFKNEIYLNLISETIMRISIFKHKKLYEIQSFKEFKNEYDYILTHELFNCIIEPNQRKIVNNSKEVMTKSIEKHKEYINENSYSIFKNYSKR